MSKTVTRLSAAAMLAVLASGGSVLHEGRIITDKADLPRPEDLAETEADRAAVEADLREQIAALQARLPATAPVTPVAPTTPPATPAAPPTAPPAEGTGKPLSEYTVNELRALPEAEGLDLSLNKAALIAAIEAKRQPNG